MTSPMIILQGPVSPGLSQYQSPSGSMITQEKRRKGHKDLGLVCAFHKHMASRGLRRYKSFPGFCSVCVSPSTVKYYSAILKSYLFCICGLQNTAL